MRFRFLVVGIVLSAASFGQNALVGPNEYPQFRTLSGLPGGGFGVNPDGTPNIAGAYALATPIAYSLAYTHFAFGASNTSLDSKTLIMIHANQGTANGKVWGMAGILPHQYGDLTLGGTLIDGRGMNLGHSVMNLQYTPKVDAGIFKFAAGCQDVFANAGSSGEATENVIGKGHSDSPYAVSTAELGSGFYASAGIGFNRFKKGFANLSATPLKGVKAVIEHDGYNFNYGVATDLTTLFGAGDDGLHLTTGLHLTANRYLGWTVNLTF